MEKEGNLKDILLGAGLGLVVVIISNYNGGINLSVRMYGSRGEASIIIYIVGATACCISCLLVCKFLKHIKVCRLFATIGSSTLIIYMLHSWIFVLIDKIMAETTVWGDIEYALFKVLVALAVSLFIDCLFKKFKKRYRNVLSDK
ncbi:MAG: hypothetical protein HDR38_06430 [Treponema sp.]|nr:hypothetical protein [Treponema sp.]